MTSSPEALEALARAYDREDASQRGEPTPWDDVEDLTWRAERIACAQVGLAAYLASSPEGRQEAAVLDVVEEMRWFDSRGGLAIGMHEALRRWISALPAPVAAVGVKALEWHTPVTSTTLCRCDTVIGIYRVWTHHEANGRWFWSLDGCEKKHGDDNPTEDAAKVAAQSDYEARLSVLIPANPAVESICSNCSGKGTEPGYVNDDGPPVDIKCEICGGAKPAMEVVEALVEKACQSFAKHIGGEAFAAMSSERQIRWMVAMRKVLLAALQAPATLDAQTEVEK